MLENNAGSLLHTVLFGGCEYRDLSQWYSSVLKFALAMLTVLVPFFVDNLRRPIVAVSGAFVLMIGDDLTNSSKMFGILTFLIYYVLKESCLKMKRLKLNFQWTNKEVSSSIAVHRLVDPNEKRIPKSDPELVVFDKTKLCTEFSDMNLGELCKSAPYTSEQCYLFKSSKMLIQPPKLRINYHESYDMQRESPTNSSGYESLVSFLKSTSDYISEFDSISNVDTSRSNDLLLSSYYRNSKAPHLIESKKCNKLSPRHLLDNSSYDLTNNMTNFHTKTSIPIYRIMLCSILCFTLGFLFQMVIAKFI